jgi:hypothetical protein
MSVTIDQLTAEVILSSIGALKKFNLIITSIAMERPITIAVAIGVILEKFALVWL